MAQITVTTAYPTGFTLVPDAFIDRFLSGSNGEYIKVYLYMLKALRCGDAVDTSVLADALEKEEADIVRALKYWEKKGVFELQTDGKTVTRICIKRLEETVAQTAEEVIPEIGKELREKAFKSSHTLPTGQKGTEVPEDVTLLITAAEGYFNRTMTVTDQNIILYMYDDLGLSFELIDYLFCRAVETKKTRLQYIEKVAVTLHENEIRTVNEAKKMFQENSDIVHVVMHAFGLQSRQPTTAEHKFIAKWSDTFGFDKELIEEACTRSALNTNSGNFQYADKILASWHTAGVRSKEDVERLDEAHKAAAVRKPAKSGSKATNFHDFEQRGEDIDALEKKLISDENRS